MQLFLLLPFADYSEIVRDYDATFFDFSNQIGGKKLNQEDVSEPKSFYFDN